MACQSTNPIIFSFLIIVFGTNILLSQPPSYVERLTSEIHKTDSDSTKGHNYISLSQYYLRRDVDKVKIYIDSAEALSNFNQSIIGKGLVTSAKGELKIRQKKNDEGLALLLQAKELYLELNNINLLNYIDYKIGAVYLGEGDYIQANNSFLSCRKYASLTNDSLDVARALNALGVVQRRLDNLDKAYEYYAEALPIYIAKKHSDGHSTTLLNMAIIEKQRKNYTSSEDMYGRALSLAEEDASSSKSLLAYIYGNMSALFDETKEYKKAIVFGEKSLELRKVSATSEELANSYTGLASNNYHLGRYNKALSYVRLAQQLAEKDERLLHQVKKIESDIYVKMDNYKSAYLLLAESNNHRDSIYSADKNKQIAEINTKYETELKASEIEKLQTEEKLNHTKINQQKYTIGGLGVGLSLVSLLGFFLYKQKTKISEQNKAISSAANEKDILLREIHHRVKNNLQVISSLLGIQGRDIKDQKAKDAIQEGRNRVQSMSLIHQNLYKKDNLTGIEMNPYIDKLAKNLLNTYQVEEGEIKIQTQVDHITLDVETVVPIGLIINELISNSLKYAFPNNRSGTISIDLQEREDYLLLSVYDNGVGLNEGQLKSKKETFGHSLIRAFRNKLGAEINITGNEGTKVELKIQNYKMVV